MIVECQTYPVTWLEALVSSNNILIDYLGYSMYMIMLCANEDSFNALFYAFYLTSRTILSRNVVRVGFLAFLWKVGVRIQSFTLEYDISYRFFIDNLYNIETIFLYS